MPLVDESQTMLHPLHELTWLSVRGGIQYKWPHWAAVLVTASPHHTCQLVMPHHPSRSLWSAALSSAPHISLGKVDRCSCSLPRPTVWSSLPPFSLNCLYSKLLSLASQTTFTMNSVFSSSSIHFEVCFPQCHSLSAACVVDCPFICSLSCTVH